MRALSGIGFGALLCLGAAPHALAQTSVTIYGILDLCMSRADKGNGTDGAISSGCQNGSRLGFRASEDLGGGQRVHLQLEQGPNLDDGSLGQGGRVFGRKVVLGWSGTQWGTVEAGRDYAATFYLLSPIDPMALGFGTLGSTMSTGANPTTVGRNNNAINYLTPTMGAISARVQIALGEQEAPAASRGRDTYSANLMWRDKAWLGGVAMNSHRDATATTRDRTFTAALSHDFGRFRLAGAFQRGQWEASRTAAAPASSTAFFSRDYRSLMLGGTVQFSDTVRLAGSLKRYDDRTSANFDATQATVLVSYAFSKRTDLYAGHSRLKNATGGAYAIQDGTTTYSGVLTGADPSLTALGIRHRF